MEENQALQVTLSSGLLKLRQLVASFSLADMADKAKAVQVTDLALRAKRARELARASMKEELEPHAEKIAEIEARWKPLVAEFGEIEDKLKALAAEHIRLDQERVAKEKAAAAERLDAANKARQEAERKVKEAAEAGTPQQQARAQLALVQATSAQGKVLDEMDAAAKPLKGVRVEGVGTISASQKWAWEIEDEKKIPREYMTPSAGRISAAVKGGVRAIPGVRIFQTPMTSIRKSPGDGARKALHEGR